jgi:hypothetical protein
MLLLLLDAVVVSVVVSCVYGHIKASPDEWGESLETEQVRGGHFLTQDQAQVTNE